jgi:hypothetical protein
LGPLHQELPKPEEVSVDKPKVGPTGEPASLVLGPFAQEPPKQMGVSLDKPKARGSTAVEQETRGEPGKIILWPTPKEGSSSQPIVLNPKPWSPPGSATELARELSPSEEKKRVMLTILAASIVVIILAALYILSEKNNYLENDQIIKYNNDYVNKTKKYDNNINNSMLSNIYGYKDKNSNNTNSYELKIEDKIEVSIDGTIYEYKYDDLIYDEEFFKDLNIKDGDFYKIITKNMFYLDLINNIDSKLSIQEIQIILNYLKYYNEEIDGIYGNKMKQAISDFQKDNHLPVNGQINDILIDYLEIYRKYIYSIIKSLNIDSINIYTNYRMTDIINIQIYLSLLRLYNGVNYGIFDNETRQAVVNFQKGLNMTDNGEISYELIYNLEIMIYLCYVRYNSQ